MTIDARKVIANAITAAQCSKEIDGPKVGCLVSWRRRCRNRTTHPSGRCRFHPLRYDDGRIAAWVGVSQADLEKGGFLPQ